MEVTDVRVRFMGGLAKLCAPEWAEEAAGALVGMLPMLGDVPPHAWASRGFLDAVATHRKRGGVPSYAEFRDALNAWQRDNPPPMLSRPDDPLARMKPEARIWVDYYHKRAGEGFAPTAGSPGGEARVLSLIKSQSPEAWSHITGEPLHVEKPSAENVEYVAGLVEALREERRETKGRAVDAPGRPARAAAPLSRADLARRYAAQGLRGPEVSADGQ